MTDVTLVAEQRLVAGRTVGVAVLDHVAAACQRRVTLETGEVPVMPITIHRLRRLTCKYQLYNRPKTRQFKLVISCLPASLSVKYKYI